MAPRARSAALSHLLDILGHAVVLPEERVRVETILTTERERVDGQLAQLSPKLRERLMANLGLTRVADFGSSPSAEAGRSAAAVALQQSALAPEQLGLIIDYSTLAADCPRIWSLANDVQGHLKADSALALSVCGAGCAGLHAALSVAARMLNADPTLGPALLVAADRAAPLGRSCLPISIMADAASALVVARPLTHTRPLAKVRSVALQQVGRFSRVLVAEGHPPHMLVDGVTFERQVLPLHFVMLHRVLTRALDEAQLKLADLDGLVYPNTTALDRQGIVRGLGFEAHHLLGPGHANLGHAFANDMLINAAALFEPPNDSGPIRTAWLAAGAGFSWGAAIVEFGVDHAPR